jgi:hypothetical protein
MTSKLPPRQNLEQYRDEGYPEGLAPIVDAILDIYKRIEETHALASRTATHPSLLGPFA